MTSERESRGLAALSLVLLVPLPTLAVVFAMVLFPGPVGQALFFVCAAAGVLLPVLWHRFVDGRKLSWSPARKGGWGVAVVSGGVISLIIVATYWLWGDALIDGQVVREAARKNGIGQPLPYLLGTLYWVTVNSLKEEYVYRWFQVQQSRRVTGSGWAAVVLAGLFFTVHHVVAMALQGFGWPVTVLAGVGVFAGGAFWSWMYVRYESVWPCYVSHAMVDVAVFGVGWMIIMG